MKRKINHTLVMMAIMAILTTTFLMVGIFYNTMRQEVSSDLRIQAEVISTLPVFDEENIRLFAKRKKDLRITWIDKDGKVLYDNDANIGKMGNHKNRPEIVSALKDGTGTAVRKSDTINKSAYYYAIRLSDGTVLRVAKEASNIWSIIGRSIPIAVLVIILMIIVSIFMAHKFTVRMIAPIEQMAVNINNYNYEPAYKELLPFVSIIREQHNAILKAARMRQDFTANVSHELKTPLTSISGYAELMENGIANESEIKHFSEEIRRNASRLLVLINDIIRLSELDGTEQMDTMEAIDLQEEIQKNVKNLVVNAKKKDVTIVCGGLPCSIMANREMIGEIIMNLCDNAIRYNKKGGSVYVSSRKEGNKAVLSVKDTGIGIAREHQKRVFERFYRVDKSRSKETGGTGLGLSIVKHIAALNNGEIYLDSEPGEGTTIEIKFPICGE